MAEAIFESRTVEVDAATLEIFVGAGSGAVLCTTHPFTPPDGNTPETLRTNQYIRTLAAAGQLVVVNPRGMGRSSAIREPQDLTMQRLADDLEAVRTALGYGRWAMVGGSSGGQVALLYALAYPDVLNALVLFSIGPVGASVLENTDALCSPNNPAHAGPTPHVQLGVEPSALCRSAAEWRQLRPDLWSYWADGRPVLMLPRPAGAPPLLRHRAALEEFGSIDVEARLHAIRVPTLVMCARHDALIPLVECERLRAIPGSKLVVLESSGHGLEEIEIVGSELRKFLAAQFNPTLSSE
jgi:proline iminopeptidase